MNSRPVTGFRVIALISAFNEEDIISQVIQHLVQNGVLVYLVDNHSTDRTVEYAKAWLGKGLVGIEIFPKDGEKPLFDWAAILRRKEQLAGELEADWFIHHDADEVRESPWTGMTLKESIRLADQLGYNSIDFKLLNFRPLDDGFTHSHDPRTYFTHFEPGEEFDRVQIKCWKRQADGVAIAASGGHSIDFPDRRVFPVQFLLRHYPIRGQRHAVKKIFAERKERLLESERQLGWHVQYDDFITPDASFLWQAEKLHAFDLMELRRRLGRFRLPRVHVVNACTTSGSIRAFHIDRPAADTELNADSLEVAGWVLAHAPHQILLVRLYESGKLLGTASLDVERPDVAAAFPGAEVRAGFGLTARTRDLPERFQLQLVALVRSEQQTVEVRLAEITDRSSA